MIGDNAFYGCELPEVEISKGVIEIGECAFYGSYSLKSITIPESVTKIDESAFEECSALSIIYIPANKTDYYKEILPEEFHDKIVELESEK